MNKLNNLVEKLKKVPRIKYVIVLMLIIFAVTVSFPTIARYKNRLDIKHLLTTTQTWDGMVATSYKKGTGKVDDPYIISNASELAYFSNMLQTTTYENAYFKLSNDIIINNGTFNYTENNITYSLSESTFYVQKYGVDIFDNKETTGTKITSINKFNPLDNFQGHFDGDYHSIYGLYITDEASEELGLFTNLAGTVENLYLENTMIYGGHTTAAISNADNTTLKNIFVSGNIIGTKSNGVDRSVLGIANYSKRKNKKPLSETITLPTIDATRPIQTLKLSGTYTSTNTPQNIFINGEEVAPGSFSIDLGKTAITSVTIAIDSETASTIALKSMYLEVIYKEANAAGIVAVAENTTLTNAINKANIYSDCFAAGLIGKSTDTSIYNAYNTGTITAVNQAAGLVASIEDSTTKVELSKLYNNGQLVSEKTNSYVNTIKDNQEVTISNTFNLQTATSQYTSDQDLTLTNVLDVNQTTIQGIQVIAIDTVKNKDYCINTLGFKEYIDSENLALDQDAIWVYEQNYLPILHIDDLNEPIAVLNIGTYTFEDIGYELMNVYFNDKTAFMISSKKPDEVISVSYYIHEGETALTKQEVQNISTWTDYTEIVQLNNEGYYTVYVKATNEAGITKYINSERLVIDLTAPEATITMNDVTWTTINSNLINHNISEATNISLQTQDTYSEILEQKYYISNIYLTEDELKELPSETWQNYTQPITIDSKGTYVINVKTTDERGHTSYFNTDYIIFGGYEETVTVGRNNQEVEKINITDNSQVTFNFKYEDITAYQEGYTNYLITSSPLPINTKITLIDNNTSEVFTYKQTTSLTKIPLNTFTKVGQSNNQVTFNDKKYIDEATKNLSLIIDFKDTALTENYTFTAYIEINNVNDKEILSTLKSTLKTVNVYNDTEPVLTLTKTEQEIPTININSDSTTEINLEAGLIHQTVNDETILDTKYENQKLGIAIRLVDLNENIVAKRYLKNIRFKLDGEYYSADNDGIVRIKLSDTLDKVNKTLSIETFETTTKLETGTYNLVITPFIASDGKYTTDLSRTPIKIPLTTTKTEEIVDYGFNVIMDAGSKMIYKEHETTTMNFIINEKSSFQASNVRVSLYKKTSFSGYDQNYELINLQDYVIDTLTKAEDNIYYVTSDKLVLSLNTTRFEKTGYELRFELYDGTKKITTVKKKFIVR